MDTTPLRDACRTLLDAAARGAVLVDRPLPLRETVSGRADGELPGHTRRLLALLDR